MKLNNQTTDTVDGEFIFTVVGPTSAESTDQVTKYVQIRVEDGTATGYRVAATKAGLAGEDYTEAGTAVVTGLVAGDYTVTEESVTGFVVTEITGGKTGTANEANRTVTLTVTAGESDPTATAAIATFTNNKEEYDLIVVKTLDGDTAPASDEYEITITSTDAEMNITAGDVEGEVEGTFDLSGNKKTLKFNIEGTSGAAATVTVHKLTAGSYTVSETSGTDYAATYKLGTGEGTFGTTAPTAELGETTNGLNSERQHRQRSWERRQTD